MQKNIAPSPSRFLASHRNIAPSPSRPVQYTMLLLGHHHGVYYPLARCCAGQRSQGYGANSLPRSKPSWMKPTNTDAQLMSEPGWTPPSVGGGQPSWKAVPAPAPIGSSHQGREGRPPPINVSQPGAGYGGSPRTRGGTRPGQPSGPPAWRGTLKSSGAPRLWELEAQDGIIPPQTMEVPRYGPRPAAAGFSKPVTSY